MLDSGYGLADNHHQYQCLHSHPGADGAAEPAAPNVLPSSVHLSRGEKVRCVLKLVTSFI